MCKKLTYRLSLNNINKEYDLICGMNQRLEIRFDVFCKIDLICHLTREQILQLIEQIKFVHYCKGNAWNHEEHVRLEYENAQKLLLVTGIQKNFVEKMLTQFMNIPKRFNDYYYQNRDPSAKIISTNQFWICIEALTEDIAAGLKKFLRNEKRNMD